MFVILEILFLGVIVVLNDVSGDECGPNQYLDSSWRKWFSECTNCTQCAPGYRVHNPCKADEDTSCKLCPPGKYSSDGLRCHRCKRKCPHGQEMVKKCHRTSDMKCQKCGEGAFFSKYLKRCKRCSVCAMGYELKKPCQTNKNTVCKPCKRNRFKDQKSGTCKRCTVCGPGYSMFRYCSFRGDAICRPCPDGMYNNQPNKPHYCNPCTRCEPGRETVTQCNSTHDTVCGNCTTGYFELPLTNSSQCVRCSKCDDKDDVKQVVEECRVMMNDPNMICLPAVVLRHRQMKNTSGKESFEEYLSMDLEVMKTALPQDSSSDQPQSSLMIGILCVGVLPFVAIIASIIYVRIIRTRRTENKYRDQGDHRNDAVDDQRELLQTPLSSTKADQPTACCDVNTGPPTYNMNKQAEVSNWTNGVLGHNPLCKSSSSPEYVYSVTMTERSSNHETRSLSLKFRDGSLESLPTYRQDGAYSDLVSVSVSALNKNT